MIVADRALLDRLEALTDEERAAFKFSLGPFELDLANTIGLRLNEHVLHTWDIDVAVDPTKTLPNDAVDVVIDNLAMIIGWAGKSDGNGGEIVIKTTDPSRTLSLKVGERLSLEPADESQPAAIEMPAEAFIRLVYGRLDPDHTPAGIEEGAVLDRLRAMFPGF